MRLLHRLLSAAHHSFSVSAQHVPSVNNQKADALSRFRWQDFRQLVPDEQPHPSWIPQIFWRLWHLCLRAAVLFFLDTGPCSVYLLFVCFRLSKAYFRLPPAGQVTSLRDPPPRRWMDILPFSSLILARTIQHSSIKVYLSGIRALHIEQGFPDPLMNFLRLLRAVRGIKRCQGSSSSNQLPITDDLMLVIWRSLDLHPPDQQDP